MGMRVSIVNNLLVKQYNEIEKYKNLEIDINKMWHLKTTTVPVILGVLGMIKNGRDKHITRYQTVLAFMKYKKEWLCGSVNLPMRVVSMSLINNAP